MPLAPGRGSTTTACPHASVSFCPIRRAMMSGPEPGVVVAMMRIGLVGYVAGVAAYTQGIAAIANAAANHGIPLFIIAGFATRPSARPFALRKSARVVSKGE